jgi:hypothetical protein
MSLLPVKFQRALVHKSKGLLVLSNRSQVLRFAGKRVYDLMQQLIKSRFASVRGVRAVYLCHSLAAGECYPGLSDFDLVVVFDSPDPLEFYANIRTRWGSLKRYCPINDLSLLTVDEFKEWQLIGGGWDPLDEVRHWKLLTGEEQRGIEFDPTGEAAAQDRMAWALGHFQNLLGVAIKEEQQSRFMAIIARRQLYKCFWNTVLALDPKYLAIRKQRERIAKWIEDNGTPGPVDDLQTMFRQKFLSGPVTVLRFEAAALAYRLLDTSLKANPLAARLLFRPERSEHRIPIGNFDEVRERASSICASLREMMEEKILSIIAGSTGSARGYTLYVILQDGLSSSELAAALSDVRAIHRVFDDVWFNEHLPEGIPTICSRAMFIARLQTGRSSLHYMEKFRLVMHGPDLYEEALSQPDPIEIKAQSSTRSRDWRREQLVYSLHLHQVYLAYIKPALYEYITFYLPRLMMQRKKNGAPATAEEAVIEFSRLPEFEQGDLPRRMFDRFQGKDLDFLINSMGLDAFNTAWPLLRQGLHSGSESP